MWRKLRVAEGEALGFVGEAIRRTRTALADQVPVIGFCGAPFTLASYMVEGAARRASSFIKRLLFRATQSGFHALFDKLVQTLSSYLGDAGPRRGVLRVQIFDSWGGELAPRGFAEFSLPYLTRLVSAARGMGVPVILFGTSMSTLLPQMKQTGADVLGLDWRIEIDEARRVLGPDVAVQGNLDRARALPAARRRSANAFRTSAAARAREATSSTWATAFFRLPTRMPRRRWSNSSTPPDAFQGWPGACTRASSRPSNTAERTTQPRGVTKSSHRVARTRRFENEGAQDIGGDGGTGVSRRG